ncbi:MAG: ChbG/HpnK family deacetylase [Desulfobulbaceae bacterium]|nr:ChbG/HpnK family deacetylase [Desulfobulbaceae bacterium]
MLGVEQLLGQRTLIVNADDFGIAKQVNAGIIHAHRYGIVTAASLMTNGDAFQDAVALGRSFSELDIGIHLTLVEEKPVLDRSAIPSLTKNSGLLPKNVISFVLAMSKGEISLADVRKELEAQFSKVIESGIAPSHIDSHQHLHLLPQILPVVVELAEQFQIKYIRLPREQFTSRMIVSRSQYRTFQLLLLRLACKLTKRFQIKTTENFVGFFDGGRLSCMSLHDMLKSLATSGCTELMCHPGFTPGRSYQHWKYNWENEVAALCHKSLPQTLRDLGIRLTTFRALGP